MLGKVPVAPLAAPTVIWVAPALRLAVGGQ
jgi:hypothetical protein